MAGNWGEVAGRRSYAMKRTTRVRFAALVAAVAALGVTTTLLGTASADSGTCAVDYQVTNSWPGGYQAAVKITNTGPAISGWSLAFDLPAGHTISNGWGGDYSQTGTAVSIGSASWNGDLGTGASTSPGFVASYGGGGLDVPTSFRLNGEVCNGGQGPAPTTTTTQAPTTTTQAPTTSTQPPTTQAPTTQPPTTQAPTTQAPTTMPPGHGDQLTEQENLELILSNPSRNRRFDDHEFRDVPMDQINLSDLTEPGDLFNTKLVNAPNSGQFRVLCEFTHFAYDDPIVHPGKPGAAHLHMVFGNTEANAYSTFESLRDTGTGSCNGRDLNRTAYWVPAVLDKDGNALIPFVIMVYYKNSNFTLGGANELVEPYPDNLRMIVGDAGARSPQNLETDGPGSFPGVSWSCAPAFSGRNKTMTIPDCYGNGQGPFAGNALEMNLSFPQCYDPSSNTYTTDGSHMSYSVGGYYGARCPASHPYDVSSIMYRIFFDPDSYGGALTDLHLSSDVLPDRTLPGGTTIHGDWFGAWHPEAMRMWVDNCNNQAGVDCGTGMLNTNPKLSMLPRKQGYYTPGKKVSAADLIKLCPGKEIDPNEPMRSVAVCKHGGH